MRLPTTILLSASLALSLTISACGEGGEQTTAPGGPATAEQKPASRTAAPSPETRRAVAEIEQVKLLLRRALATYRRREGAAAERMVGDAYLEHFELVEHSLEERDKELMESLEVAVSTTIRNKMKQGAAAAEIEGLVVRVERDLDRARGLLLS
jgi:hypothetical protein